MAFPKGDKRLGEKAKRPMQKVPLSKKQITELLLKHHGNISRVADSIGSTRMSVRRFIDNDPELQETLLDSRERIIDELEESCWTDAINNPRDAAMRCFLLKTQARHRGYEQDEAKNTAKDIATAAFDFILNKSKNPAEPSPS